MRQAFHYFDKDGDGYIGPTEFQRIIVVCCSSRRSLRAESCRKSQGISYQIPC